MKTPSQLLISCLTMLAVIGILLQQASADLTLDFSTDGGTTFSSNINVATGELVQIEVFLRDSEQGGVLETVGLFGLGLSAIANRTDTGEIIAASINPAFDFDITEEFTASTLDWEDAVLNNQIPTGSAVLLGSFQYDTFIDGITVFTFQDIQPGSGSPNANWLSGAGAILDEEIFGAGASNTFQLSLNASSIPEPTGTIIIALGLFALSGSRKRKICSRE